MSNVARRRYLFGLFAIVLFGVLLWRLVAGGWGNDAGQGVGGASLAASSRSFTIDGNTAEQISPGAMVPLDLRFTNLHDLAIVVSDLRISVQQVSAPHADGRHPCMVADFTVSQLSSNSAISVAARASNTLSSMGLPRATWPRVGMLDRSVDQDGCKGASLTLGYAASGTAKK